MFRTQLASKPTARRIPLRLTAEPPDSFHLTLGEMNEWVSGGPTLCDVNTPTGRDKGYTGRQVRNYNGGGGGVQVELCLTPMSLKGVIVRFQTVKRSKLKLGFKQSYAFQIQH